MKNAPTSAILAATLAGGVIAPALLTYGLRSATAFETVATTLIAWLIFKENIGRNIFLGKSLIVAVAIMIATQGELGFSPASILILGTCLFWGIDNNVTRDLEDLAPSALACIKGWAARTGTYFSTGNSGRAP